MIQRDVFYVKLTRIRLRTLKFDCELNYIGST